MVWARYALIVGVLSVLAATAGGASLVWRRHRAATKVAGPVVPSARAHLAPQHFPPSSGAPARPVSPERPSSPVPAPQSLTPPAHAVPRVVASSGTTHPSPSFVDRRSEVTPAITESSASESSASEARLLALALSQLRRMHDAGGALATLGQYDRAFPHGVLASEALTARLEADLQLGDFDAGLALLDGVTAFPDPLGPELRLTRAELRARAGRYPEALVDFSEVLERRSGAISGAATERALHGRAICFSHVGEDLRARTDLRTYQMRFPNGRFADEVARLLAAPTERVP
jgi:hypothetical protein